MYIFYLIIIGLNPNFKLNFMDIEQLSNKPSVYTHEVRKERNQSCKRNLSSIVSGDTIYSLAPSGRVKNQDMIVSKSTCLSSSFLSAHVEIIITCLFDLVCPHIIWTTPQIDLIFRTGRSILYIYRTFVFYEIKYYY